MFDTSYFLHDLACIPHHTISEDFTSCQPEVMHHRYINYIKSMCNSPYFTSYHNSATMSVKRTLNFESTAPPAKKSTMSSPTASVKFESSFGIDESFQLPTRTV